MKVPDGTLWHATLEQVFAVASKLGGGWPAPTAGPLGSNWSTPPQT